MRAEPDSLRARRTADSHREPGPGRHGAVRPDAPGCAPSGSGRSLVHALALCFGLAACGRNEPTMSIERVEVDLLAGDPFWEVVDAPADYPPRVGFVTPTTSVNQDGADRVALVLHPGSEVRFTIPDATGPLLLRTAAGVHLSLARRLARGDLPPVTIDFELWLDDRSVFQESVTTQPMLAVESYINSQVVHRWHPVGADGEVPVRPGQVVRLRVSLAPGSSVEGLGRIRAGFADLLLVRHEERARERATPERPNVVLIVMDTLRADRTTPYGDRPTTPNLTQLAQRGLLFESAYSSSSWTWPSVSSLLTGLEPAEHGVLSNTSCLLANDIDTLAEALQADGWTTATFTGNPLLSPWRNFDQGVETFDFGGDIRESQDVVPQGLQWMEAQGDTRFFVHFQLMDSHSPHLPRREDLERFCGVRESARDPRLINGLNKTVRLNQKHTPEGAPDTGHLVNAEDARWLSNVYDACVATGDYWLGQILRQVESQGIADRTLIIYTSDHGEELFDHGLLEHAHTLYEELIHVPLVIAGPSIPAGRVQGLVPNRLLGPTIAQHVGAALAGESLALEPGQAQPRRLFFDTRKGWWNGHEFQPVFGVRDGDWILHYSPEGRPWGAAEDAPPGEGQMRLFQLAEDPRQLHDLSAVHPERARAMRELILEHQAELAARTPVRRSRRGGDAMLEVLRSMGYAGDSSQSE